MRVVAAREVGIVPQPVRREPFSGGDYCFIAAYFPQYFPHFALQVQSVVHDHVRSGKPAHVPLGGFVKVRVYARAHQCHHLRPVPDNIADGVS